MSEEVNTFSSAQSDATLLRDEVEQLRTALETALE